MYERHRRRYTLWPKEERKDGVLLLKIHRETEVLYPLETCTDAQELKEEPHGGSTCTDPPVEGVCRSASEISLPESESVGDGDSLMLPDTPEDTVFKQDEDSAALTGDSTSGVSMSWSTSSINTDSSSIAAPSDPVPPEQGHTPPPITPTTTDTPPITTGETEEDERKDRLTEVPERSVILRSSVRSQSPTHRHSWSPGRSGAAETDGEQGV